MPTHMRPHHLLSSSPPFLVPFFLSSGSKRCRLPKKFDGTSYGFAFFRFVTTQETEIAFDTLQRTDFYGRHLVLQYANEIDSVEDIREKTRKVEQKELSITPPSCKHKQNDTRLGVGVALAVLGPQIASTTHPPLFNPFQASTRPSQPRHSPPSPLPVTFCISLVCAIPSPTNPTTNTTRSPRN